MNYNYIYRCIFQNKHAAALRMATTGRNMWGQILIFFNTVLLYFIIYCAKFYQQVHRRSRSTALTSFNLSARWSWWSISRPGRFTPDKQPCYLLHRKLGTR